PVLSNASANSHPQFCALHPSLLQYRLVPGIGYVADYGWPKFRQNSPPVIPDVQKADCLVLDWIVHVLFALDLKYLTTFEDDVPLRAQPHRLEQNRLPDLDVRVLCCSAHPKYPFAGAYL